MDICQFKLERFTFLVCMGSPFYLLLFISARARVLLLFASHFIHPNARDIRSGQKNRWELISDIGRISFKGLSMPVSTGLKNCFHWLSNWMPYLPREFYAPIQIVYPIENFILICIKALQGDTPITDNRSPRALANEYVTHISKSFKLIHNLTVQKFKDLLFSEILHGSLRNRFKLFGYLSRMALYIIYFIWHSFLTSRSQFYRAASAEPK